MRPPQSCKEQLCLHLLRTEIPRRKNVLANFDAAGKFFTDSPAAQNAIPAKVWAFSSKEKMAAGRLAPPSGTLLDFLLCETATAFLTFFSEEDGKPQKLERPLCRNVSGIFVV